MDELLKRMLAVESEAESILSAARESARSRLSSARESAVSAEASGRASAQEAAEDVMKAGQSEDALRRSERLSGAEREQSERVRSFESLLSERRTLVVSALMGLAEG